MNEAAQIPSKTVVAEQSIIESINKVNDDINQNVHGANINTDNEISNIIVEEIINNIETTCIDDNECDETATNDNDNLQSSNNYEITDIIITNETISKLQQNRRSETMKSLQKESFAKNTQNNEKKQNAFYTNKPLVWYQAIKEFLIVNHITNRCDLNKK